VSANESAHEHLRLYLLGLLSALLGEEDVALRYARELSELDGPQPVLALARDLAAGVRAQVSLGRANAGEALATLEGTRFEAWYQSMLSSPFYSQDRERYLRAELLAARGREEEALTWYGSFAEGSIYELVYLAPSHLRRAEIYERRGERERAVGHYRRFIELWRDCDPNLQPMVEEAERALARMSEKSVNGNRPSLR
jgi:tetratricopeptide (TPR) repeat protein